MQNVAFRSGGGHKFSAEGAITAVTDSNDVSGAGHSKLAEHLAVGRIVGAHGIRGELKVQVLTDFDQRFEPGSMLIVEGEESGREVLSARPHKTYLLVQLQGITNRTEAQQQRGLHLLVQRDQAIPLPEGEYYADELEGLRVMTTGGEDLGVLTEVWWTAANEIYVVQGPFGEVLLPAVADVIQEVDLQSGEMLVSLLPGLVQSLD
jgi:16S rRNA processing protein RimM